MKKKKKGKNNSSTSVEKKLNSPKEENLENEELSETEENLTKEEKSSEEKIVKEDNLEKGNSLKDNSEKETLREDAENDKDSSKEITPNADDLSEEEHVADSDEKETSEDNADAESDAELSEFLHEIWGHISKWMRNNQKICLIAGSICVVAILVITIISVITKQRDSQIVDATASINNITAAPLQNEVIPVPQEPLLENAYPEVNALITQYFTAMQSDDLETLAQLRDYLDTVEAAKIEVKCEYVEAYQNIVCYTKPGPFENSYIVYVVCDVKFVDWDEPAPSILAKLVCTREDGSLYVYEGDFDANVADYIRAISSQQDVDDLFTRVKTEYSELLDANPEFAAYMDALNQTIKDEVGEVLAAETVSGDSVSEDASMAASENSVSENSDSETIEEASDGTEESSFQVKTTTTVNVRMSDSEEADKMGKVEGGTILTCNEQRANGWSQIVYEGEIGYIKTEYLVEVDADGNETQSASSEKVTVSETVNIRETPDTDGEKVGVAYAGESFTLVEDMGNGWTKIMYNGKEAYIKTEFIAD